MSIAVKDLLDASRKLAEAIDAKGAEIRSSQTPATELSGITDDQLRDLEERGGFIAHASQCLCGIARQRIDVAKRDSGKGGPSK